VIGGLDPGVDRTLGSAAATEPAAPSAAAGRLLGSLLFGVQPIDLSVLAAMAVFLLAASVLAAYSPAARASRLDAMTALRSE